MSYFLFYLWVLAALVTTFVVFKLDTEEGIPINLTWSEVIILPAIMSIAWWILAIYVIVSELDRRYYE